MNLNPLKKEDNTEALVKALEDANGSTQTAVSDQPNPDPSAVTLGDAPVDSPADDNTSPTLGDPSDTSTPSLTDETTTPAMGEQSTVADPAAALSFDGNDLPAGLSGDADAHIDTTATGDNSEIDGVKKSALEQLRPLIEKLDLEPADKFDKYLMMLRASDDPALIKPAFDAAQGIAGEKEKAQALLDIINEINYITANQQQAQV